MKVRVTKCDWCGKATETTELRFWDVGGKQELIADLCSVHRGIITKKLKTARPAPRRGRPRQAAEDTHK